MPNSNSGEWRVSASGAAPIAERPGFKAMLDRIAGSNTIQAAVAHTKNLKTSMMPEGQRS
jgi:hypothetical protein